MSYQPPSDLVELGQVFDAQGLKGHIKVRPHSQDPVALLNCKEIYLQRDGTRGLAMNTTYSVSHAKMHGAYVIMAFEGVNDRDAALSLKGASLNLPRHDFPDTGKDSYYWMDLIGCAVVNQDGVFLGLLDEIAEYGAHPVMTVGKELIPFVPQLVRSVELKESDLSPRGTIVVEWQANWSQ